MDMEGIYTLMEITILEIGQRGKDRGGASWQIKMEKHMKGCGSLVNLLDNEKLIII